jgi:hypothetical protein
VGKASRTTGQEHSSPLRYVNIRTIIINKENKTAQGIIGANMQHPSIMMSQEKSLCMQRNGSLEVG